MKCSLQTWAARSLLLALINPSSNHYRMTYIPLWTKRKRTLSWYISTFAPLLHWHSNLLWCTLWDLPIFRISQLVLVQSTTSNRILVWRFQHSPFYLLHGKIGGVSYLEPCWQRAKGRAAGDTSSCLEAWSSQRRTTQMPGIVQRKSMHFIREKAAAEWSVIKAIIESSVIFKSWWQWCKLIACIHYLHLISYSLFPRKSQILKGRQCFFKAAFTCQMHPFTSQSVAAGGEISIHLWSAAGLFYCILCIVRYCMMNSCMWYQSTSDYELTVYNYLHSPR